MDPISLISGLFTDLDTIGRHADDVDQRSHYMHLCENGLWVIGNVRLAAGLDTRQEAQLHDLEAGFTLWLARLGSGDTAS